MKIHPNWRLGVAALAIGALTACGGGSSDGATLAAEAPATPFRAPLSCEEYVGAATNTKDAAQTEAVAAFTRGEWEYLLRKNGLMVKAASAEAKVQRLQGDTVTLCGYLPQLDAKEALARTYANAPKTYWP